MPPRADTGVVAADRWERIAENAIEPPSRQARQVQCRVFFRIKRKGKQSHLTLNLQDRAIRLILSENGSEWVTFWSLFEDEVINHFEGRNLLKAFEDG